MNSEHKWSSGEKKEGRRIFEIARGRALQEVIDQHHALQIESIDDIWNYGNELRKKRRELDEALDYRYSVLARTLARCVRRKWLKVEELEGLPESEKEKALRILEF